MKLLRATLLFSLVIMASLKSADTAPGPQQLALPPEMIAMVVQQSLEKTKTTLRNTMKEKEPQRFEALMANVYVVLPKQALQQQLKALNAPEQATPILKTHFDKHKIEMYEKGAKEFHNRLHQAFETFVKTECITPTTAEDRAKILLTNEASAEELRTLTTFAAILGAGLPAPRGLFCQILETYFEERGYSLDLSDEEKTKNAPFTAAVKETIINGINKQQANFKKQLEKPDAHKTLVPMAQHKKLMDRIEEEGIYLLHTTVNSNNK